MKFAQSVTFALPLFLYGQTTLALPDNGLATGSEFLKREVTWFDDANKFIKFVKRQAPGTPVCLVPSTGSRSLIVWHRFAHL